MRFNYQIEAGLPFAVMKVLMTRFHEIIRGQKRYANACMKVEILRSQNRQLLSKPNKHHKTKQAMELPNAQYRPLHQEGESLAEQV